jgi:hypothetical protein
MTDLDHAPTGELTGWVRTPFTGGGVTHDRFEQGSGPGVVLIPELPGLTPEVLGLAKHLVSEGFTVSIPSPFGTPGREGTLGYTLASVSKVCVSAEFKAFATGAHRPVADHVRALAADLAARTPGPGVGVIGMCFSGGFALAAADMPGSTRHVRSRVRRRRSPRSSGSGLRARAAVQRGQGRAAGTFRDHRGEAR